MKTIIEQKIEDIEQILALKIADKNAKNISEQISDFTLGDGSFSHIGFWKVKSRIVPGKSNPPMAKRDAEGNLVTSPENLRALYLETYRKRLKHRKIDSKYEDIEIMKNELWNRRLSWLKGKVTNP